MNDAHPSILQRRWPRFWAIMGIFTVLGLIDAGQVYLHVKHFRGNTLNLEESLAIGLGDWYLWAALTPIIVRLARRFPIDSKHWRSRLLIHMYFGCLIMLLKIALDLVLNFAVVGRDWMMFPLSHEDRILPNYEYLIPLFKSFVFGKFYIYLVVYGVIVGASHFMDYYQKFVERELQGSRLETQLAQAQVEVLRMQLQPHFLFNTLNAIAALMQKDVRLADRMIARLGELLRATLEHPPGHEGTLREELSFLRPYLEIEQARLGPRLSVTIDVPGELLDARLPYLLIQPLAENAIRHGIAPRVGPGRLTIRVRRTDQRLVIEVSDNGVGLPPHGQARDGIGLSNTRGRLKGLYGEEGNLVLETGPDGGVVATVKLPYREELETGSTDYAVASRPASSAFPARVPSRAASSPRPPRGTARSDSR
jgi:hypothetical protein